MTLMIQISYHSTKYRKVQKMKQLNKYTCFVLFWLSYLLNFSNYIKCIDSVWKCMKREQSSEMEKYKEVKNTHKYRYMQKKNMVL